MCFQEEVFTTAGCLQNTLLRTTNDPKAEDLTVSGMHRLHRSQLVYSPSMIKKKDINYYNQELITLQRGQWPLAAWRPTALSRP